MGSLMAGWRTSHKDAQQAALKRSTSSRTNDEVNKYWRAKANSIREHFEEAQMAAGFIMPYNLSKFEMNDDSYEIKQGTASLPATPTWDGRPEDEGVQKADWWTMSRFAYLNEPPVQKENKQFTYVAQFDVAMKGAIGAATARTRALLNSRSTGFYVY